MMLSNSSNLVLPTMVMTLQLCQLKHLYVSISADTVRFAISSLDVKGHFSITGGHAILLNGQ